jgi:hypothetical protein
MPTLPEGLVQRRQILDSIAAERDVAVVLVTGPAGFALPVGSMLVIGSRVRLRLRVGRLLLAGRAVRVKADDLTLSVDEAAQMAHSLGLCLPPNTVEQLVERTEGWLRDPMSGDPAVLQRREIVFTYGGKGAASILFDADGSGRWADIDGTVSIEIERPRSPRA